MPNYSPDFRGANDLSAKNLFRQRDYYKAQTTVLFDPIPNSIDLWNERPYYGKIDLEGKVVIPNSDYLKYSGRDDLVVLDFVFDAFEDLRSYLNRATRLGRTDLAHELFGNFTAVEGYVNPVIKYLAYGSNLMSAFNSSLEPRGLILPNIEEYMKEFLKFVEAVTDIVTFSSYYTSSRLGINATGIAIDLLDDEDGNDYTKNKIFKNKDFYTYVQSAANFGFRIDKNAPWRLIADLNSIPMKRYCLKYNIPSLGMLFSQYFESAILYDAYTLLTLFHKGYEDYQRARRFEYKTHHCFKASPRFKVAVVSDVTSWTQKINIKEISYDSFVNQYYNIQFLKTLAYIKFLEAKNKSFSNYSSFSRKFVAALKGFSNDSMFLSGMNALSILEDYYNPTKLYRTQFSQAPYYINNHGPSEQKKALTYKQTLGTLYKTNITLPGIENLDLP